jgi:hypothetical protein
LARAGHSSAWFDIWALVFSIWTAEQRRVTDGCPGGGVTTLIQRLAELSADGFQSLASDCRSEPGEICCDGRVDHALQDVADHRQIASAGMWGAHDGWSPNLGPRRRFLMVVAGVLDASMLRYFLIAFDLTLMMAAPAAAAADLVIDGVPFPSDASVASVPTSAMHLQRHWSAVWVGAWDGTLKHVLLVERIGEDGAAGVVLRSLRIYTPGRRRGGGDWTRLCPDKRLP